jgi:hypothetical protein
MGASSAGWKVRLGAPVPLRQGAATAVARLGFPLAPDRGRAGAGTGLVARPSAMPWWCMSAPYIIVFAYLLAVAALVALGVLALAVALVLAIWPPCRRIARRLTGGVVGSLLFLFFFQGLSVPVLAAITIISLLLGVWSGPADTPNVTVAIGALVLGLAVFFAASVAGIITGWGVGAGVGSGTPLRDALRASRALASLAAGLSRLSPIPLAVSPERTIAMGLGIIIVAVGGLTLARMAYVEAYGSAEIDYRGEKIQLARKYVDYDDYKNDPDNLAAPEIARVERLMTEARIGPDFASWKDFADQASTIKFPGYAMNPGPKVVAAGREFVVEVIEIPQVAKDRYFVLENLTGGTLRLVDDFVTPHSHGTAFLAIPSVHLVDDRLIYSDRDSKIVRETPLAPQR